MSLRYNARGAARSENVAYLGLVGVSLTLVAIASQEQFDTFLTVKEDKMNRTCPRGGVLKDNLNINLTMNRSSKLLYLFVD